MHRPSIHYGIGPDYTPLCSSWSAGPAGFINDSNIPRIPISYDLFDYTLKLNRRNYEWRPGKGRSFRPCKACLNHPKLGLLKLAKVELE